MRIITRTILILSFVSLFADLTSEMLYPVIPIYLKEIGFSIVWIGILEGFVDFTAGISKGYFGKLSDEKGVRLPFIKLGYGLSALSKPLIVLFVAPAWIFFVRTLDRLGKGVRVAAKDALLSAETTKTNKATVFGFNRALHTAGATIGPAIALVFLLFYPGEYKTLFYLAFIPGIISVLLIFLLKEKKQPASTMEKGNFFSFFKYWKIATKEYKHLVTGLLLFALFNSSDVFLLLKTKEIIGDDTIKIFGSTFDSDTITIAAYVFYNLVWALGSYPSGIAFTQSIATIFILFFVYGLFYAATDGVSKAWITNTAHNKNTATAIGFYTSCQSICTLGASTIAGLIWEQFGSSYTFISTAAIAFIVFIFLLLKLANKSTG